ncbi:hypothetical protein [Fibrella forsythiae]|uniref:Uncharacterized protein n=1 Tax=Fibrella forsythiae TaxID=2817061 RepID=A0ABS3JAD1_9BACT|nr:hypothetical protein [Fibrella forsythiae]MBO0946957.1 hypothetical protein [Fibrella forsythiae]
MDRSGDTESISAALVRVRAGGLTKYLQSAVSNVRSIPTTPAPATGFTDFEMIYNIMNEDGPGYPDSSGNYPNDVYATQAYSRGSEYKNAYIPEWPGRMFSILIPCTHYMQNRTSWRRQVMYRNQQAAIRAAGKKYFLRFHFSRENIGNGDDITTPANVARFNNGDIGGSGSAPPQLHLLRQYVEGGSSDTENPWHYMKAYVLKLANDFKQDVLDGVCIGLTYTLTGRQEDGLPTEIGDGGALKVGDYSPGAIADFKVRMNTSSNPPTPGHYLSMDAFQGEVGKKWYIYRQEQHMFFKAWVKGLIRSVIPGCPTGDDYGIIVGTGAANPGVANWRRMSAGSQLVKVNPDFFTVHNFEADLIRSNAPAGAITLIEADTNWVVENAYSGNPSVRPTSDVVNVINAYRQRGMHAICFGQANNATSFGAAKTVAQACIAQGMQSAKVTIATPDQAHTTSYTSDEILTGPGSLAQGRWFDAQGSNGPVNITITDTFTY